MYISHSSKIPGQPRDELQWEEEEEESVASSLIIGPMSVSSWKKRILTFL